MIDEKALQPLTPASVMDDETVPQPNPDAQVTVLPDTTNKVTFTPEQQAVFNRELKAAQGRAAKTVREEAARLKAENEALKQQVVGNDPSASEVERLRAELSARAMENDAIKREASERQKQLFITQQAQRNDFVDADIVTKLTKDNIRWDESAKTYIVVDDAGNPRTTTDGSPLSPEDFYRKYASQRKYLVRGTTISGTGSSGSHASRAQITAQEPLEKYFGPRSDAGACNRLSLRDPQKYKQLRQEALRKGLI